MAGQERSDSRSTLRFPLALHALAQKRSKYINSLTFNIGSNYANKIEQKDVINMQII